MDNQITNIKNHATIRNSIKLISLFLALMFFLPTFLVSCSGQTIDISAKTAAFGYDFRGENVIDSNFVCVLFLLIPIAIIILWSIKTKFTEKQLSIITFVGTVVDFIMWIALKSYIKKTAEENSCTFKTTGWFTINLILLILLAVICIGIYLNYLHAETNLFHLLKNSNLVKDSLEQPTTSANQVGYCESCGSPILKDNSFCTKCGHKVE